MACSCEFEDEARDAGVEVCEGGEEGSVYGLAFRSSDESVEVGARIRIGIRMGIEIRERDRIADVGLNDRFVSQCCTLPFQERRKTYQVYTSPPTSQLDLTVQIPEHDIHHLTPPTIGTASFVLVLAFLQPQEQERFA